MLKSPPLLLHSHSLTSAQQRGRRVAALPTFQLAQVKYTPSEMMVRSKKQLYYCLWPGCSHWSNYQWNTGAIWQCAPQPAKTKSAAEKKKGVVI
ncbi:hypothetical protein TYRP_023594 [Tyrophagus putrescentiae]|nr:hypothetical protein TYRP_023594 [Tyrophagus putrescentiae]